MDEPDGERSCDSHEDCECIRQFLYATRPPGINGYDGLDLEIAIVQGDPCYVLYGEGR